MQNEYRSAAGNAEALLRAHGLRVTPQRLVVIETLQGAHGHLSVEEIHAQVRCLHPSLSPVTVYRVLETLEAHGLVARGMLGDKLIRWELVAGAHHHLICQRCGAIVELDDALFQQLAADLSTRYGVHVHLRHLSLEGLCAVCAAASPAEEPAQED